VRRLFIIISIIATTLSAQPKETVEFQINTISGQVLNSLDHTPVNNLKVDLLSGNNMLKKSSITDENGNFNIVYVGYVWKPKILLVARDYHSLTMKLSPDELDSLNNITIHPMMTPIPDDQRIPNIRKKDIESRAESFFVKGSVFYYLSIINDYFSAERIIIKSKKAIKVDTGFIILKINGVYYSPERCYVPQLGKYENLSYMMDDYFPEPVFGPSGLPQYLDENLLQPTMIYGTVFDARTQHIVPGAEVSIAGTSKWRITDELGKYAFQINEPGSYQIIVNPPFGYSSSQTGIAEILVKSARGGWYLSNHHLNP
jgi:hypothetical protein